MSNNINITSNTTTSSINEVIKNIVVSQPNTNIVKVNAGPFVSSNIVGDYVTNDDPRLIDAREPLSHSYTHSIEGSDPLSPSDIGAQPAGDYTLNNDPRLNDSRNPNLHADSHKTGGSDELTPSDIGAQPAGDYVLDTDTRLSDSRNPNPHTHPKSDISDLNDLLVAGSGMTINYDIINKQYNLSSNGAAGQTIAKAWVNFNGTGIVSIRSSYNISSVTDNGIGSYTINFTTPMIDTNYTFVGWSRDWDTNNTIVNGVSARSNTPKTVNSLSIINNNILSSTNYDSPEINIIVFGN